MKINGRPVFEKKTLQLVNSWVFTSVNYIDREMPKGKGKMTQESSIYLLGMSSYKFNFIFKTSQYPWMKILINERFFSKWAHLPL